MKVKNLYVYTFVFMVTMLFIPTAFAQDTTVGESFSKTVQSFVIELLMIAAPPFLLALLGYGVQFIHKQVDFVKAKLSSEQLFLVESIVSIAVKKAEQEGLIGAISAAGQAKKAYALAFVQDALRKRGLGMLADNVDELAGVIESAINDGIHKNWKESTLTIEGIIPES